MLTDCPVRGLRTVRGRRRATVNVPKPTSVTASPRFRAARMLPSIASSARSVAVFGQSAASAMRRILIDNARRKQTLKRGGGLEREPLEPVAAPGPDAEILALDQALEKLAAADPLKAKLVELRYFVGLTSDEAAEVLGISSSTADRHWAYARAWLQDEVRGG